MLMHMITKGSTLRFVSFAEADFPDLGGSFVGVLERLVAWEVLVGAIAPGLGLGEAAGAVEVGLALLQLKLHLRSLHAHWLHSTHDLVSVQNITFILLSLLLITFH